MSKPTVTNATTTSRLDQGRAESAARTDLQSGPIVVATDGSPESVGAARWSARLARRLGTRTVVLDVLHHPFAEMRIEDVEHHQAEARDALADRLREAGVTVDEIDAVVGDVANVLTDVSRDAVLLVLGSAERAGWGRHGHFSLVHTLARHVACPIVVIPTGPWIDREPLVVVGIDGTAASRRTMEWAKSFAAQAGMGLLAAFVIDAMYTTFQAGGWWGHEERDARSESSDVSVELVERYGADPAVTLEAIADERGASLLVVGAKGHGSIGGTLLGAIPDELLHHPTCPIAVVPHALIA